MIKSIEIKIGDKFFTFEKGKNDVKSIRIYFGRVIIKFKDKKLIYKGYPYSYVCSN
jgi:hypothetical protein